ncbi:MAG: DUF559 domain-containing protein [Elusimicrobiota bacterium]
MNPIDFARGLRRTPTDAEARIRLHLRSRRLVGWKFRRQHPIGPYIVDFRRVESRLVVELDGGRHRERQQYDKKRTAFLRSKGWQVLRFWDNDALLETDCVPGAILEALPDRPSPALRCAQRDLSRKRER